MKNKFLQRLSDITHIHHRAAFTDVQDWTTSKESAFLKLAQKRYSCRAFADTEVAQVLIDQILEAARLAPTAMNKQPVHIWVIKSPEAREKLKEATQYVYGAPVVFLVACKKEDAWVRKYDGKNGAEVDAAIVGTHIMMEAADLGLGSVWVGSFNPAKILELFPETAGYEPVALFPVGIPATGPGINHGKRVNIDKFASEL